jgi:hypothetical protein
MGSFKRNGRNQGPDRRRGDRDQRRRGFPNVESLEGRVMLDGTSPWRPTSTDLSDVKNGPMANEGQDLINVYQAYIRAGNSAAGFATRFPLLRFQGNSVGVDIRGTGTFSSFLTSVRNLGVTVTTSSAAYATVEGYVPIAQLPTLAALPQTLAVAPNYKAISKFVGAANNQAEQSLNANVARQTTGLDGTGVTVGVISSSVNKFQGGLADSVRTGDLPSTVNVLKEAQTATDDEGRAMLENIHDIAPGAGLAYASGFDGQLSFADSVRALANQGNASVIVDDLGYAVEPMFQPGYITQAINDVVTNKNVSYFSAAGNTGPQAGYLSTFRGAQDTITGIGAGRFMNFAPSGAAVTQLPIITTVANVTLSFQFDQPFAIQQPAGSTAAVTSNLDIFVLDANNNVVASGTQNNVAIQAPYQLVTIPNAGSYKVAIRVTSGTDPGHVQFVDFGDANELYVSPQFGSAGGTFYPSAYGHSTAPLTVGVGAMPWWASAPFLATSPLNSEPFSSSGPSLTTRNADGSAISGATPVLNPVVTGPDGGNTSFFGGVINTATPGGVFPAIPSPPANPAIPGNPSTTNNLSQNLPSFFGTSSAAPNVAAVAALMKQRIPTITESQVIAGLKAGARPMNGTASGTWNAQSGFGLPDAVAALAAIDVLRVVTASPANGSTVTTAPNQIVITFNKPVDINTVSKANLAFQSVPSSLANLLLGNPVGVDDPRFPTTVAFPFSFTVKPGQLGNGAFTYKIQGNITSKDGKVLQPSTVTFNINDTVAPKVANATVNGRIVTVQFNEAMSPTTINATTLFVARLNPNGQVAFNLNTDPRFKISYNPATFTATLDYSGLDQSQLPTGTYVLVVLSGIAIPGGFQPGVTDVVGNKLNGAFSGVFPSGNGVVPTDFVENFGTLTLAAPVITSFTLAPGFDSGIKGDENTNFNMPTFVGQVTANFPGSVAGLTVLAEFNSLHGGNIDLNSPGRGFTGSFDVQVTTNATGGFTLPAPFLPQGFTRVRLVVIASPDSPPLPGLSSALDHAFRIDQMAPFIPGATLAPGGALLPVGSQSSGTPLQALTSLSLDVVDGMNPSLGALATPPAVLYPALDPATASNVSNYQLVNFNDLTDTDKSRFISTATFVPTASDFTSTPKRSLSSEPFFGRVDLTFAPGLNAGHYALVARSATQTTSGLTDAAANPLDDSTVPGQQGKYFITYFNIQPEPVFVVSVSTDVTNAQGNHLLPRSYYEINPRAGDIVSNPPTTFNIDFSNPLAAGNYANAVQLIRTANTANGAADGDFGTLGIAGTGSSGTGFSRFNPAGTTVTLTSGPYGSNTRLVLQLPAGTVLPADHYRLYMPNSGATVLKDIYGNQLDGKFLGNPTASATDLNGNPAYEDLLPNGQYRAGMSGDGVAGGAFEAGFVVVPTGNIVYARPDYSEDPLLASTTPDGSLSKPYSVLAPQAAPNGLNSSTLNNGDPNGGLNATVNFLSGFNPIYDRAGLGKFARSAFYAASQLSSRGPVVVVALPGTPQRDPITNLVSQKTFVLQAPSGSDPVVNDGSGSVPFDTLLVFNAGSTLKLQNASLFAQNQGSAIQALGGPNPNDRVTFTSYANDAVAGDTNNDGANTTARAGDWGGVVFRNFRQQGRTDTFPVDVTLRQGPNGAPALSGEDDALSSLNFSNISFGGGAVPATQGFRYDDVTLFNSRPAITNSSIIGGNAAGIGSGAGGSQASISGDLDSFREDDLARGPLVRRTVVSGSSLNGIWVRPLSQTGDAQATDAIPYADNPVALGGVRNYVFNSPLPYILTSNLDLGTQNITDNFGNTINVHNRLYVQPGMMIKASPGSGLRVLNPGASLILGDRTYINAWDALATIDTNTGLPVSTYGPTTAGFKPNTTGDAQVLFTSTFDNAATTSFFDPLTGLSTVIVPSIDSLNTGGTGQPTPGNVADTSRWGRVQLNSGSYGTLDEVTFRYGGGGLNVPGGTDFDPAVLQFTGAAGAGLFSVPGLGDFFGSNDRGTRFLVTNNNFFDNKDVPMSIQPNGLLAADTIHPLASGHPFFRGNVFQRNLGGNGLLVEGGNNGNRQISNVNANSLWDSTDLTYLVRNSIVMGPDAGSSFTLAFSASGPPAGTNSFLPEAKPTLVLTVQSALPDTLLANGSRIPRPGESVIIKLDTKHDNQPAPTEAFTTGANISAEDSAGAGFISGVDNGVDPTGDNLFDVGVFSQMRFLGIGANQTTGQSRIPVVITSVHDSTVGTTVRGVKQFTAIDGDTTAAAAGDGGLIYFGGNGRTDYSVLDPRGGSLIDNADIRYIARIELQGGGIIRGVDLNADNTFDTKDNAYAQKAGVFPPLANGQPNPLDYQIQYNGEHAMMISNSNLANFRDDGVFVHHGFNLLVTGVGTTPRSGQAGEPILLYMVNNTMVGMPTAIKVIGDQNSDNNNSPEPTEVVLLNNTFYNNPVFANLSAIDINFATPQISAQIHLIAMDNIIDGSTSNVVLGTGMLDGSLFQFNVFHNNGPFQTNNGTPVIDVQIPNDGAINADPLFRDPANGNFQLQPKSPAIDAARSELNLNPTTAPSRVLVGRPGGGTVGYADVSTTLLPVVNQSLDANGGIRNQTGRVPLADTAQFDPTNPPTDQLALAGTTNRGFIDLWFPTLASDPLGIPGPTTVPGSWVYKPALIPPGTKGVPGGGERDQFGNLRIDNANVPNTGFGSKPFFDIGAFEFIPFFPPHVTAVTATVTDPASTTGVSNLNLYKVGGVAGTNKAIQTINVQLDHNLDPNTVNGSTVLLEASGGDGIFGNNNSPNDKFYNLSGKVSFNPANNVLTINVGAAGLVLQNDEYRIFLLGTGSQVLRDPQGNALDGENTLNDDPNGAQLALPSGDGFPGGNFYTTFIINTQAPIVTPNTFTLADSSDTNVVGDKITSVNLPTFVGTISTPLSAITPLAGQTIIIDVSTQSNGTFDRLNAGTAVTDAQGNFSVTIGKDGANTGLVTNTSAVPDSPYNVGPDGKLNPLDGDDKGYTFFRIRVIDQSGNASNLPTDPLSAFIKNNALAAAVIDTTSPVLTTFTPSPSGVLKADPTTGKLTFSFVTSENIDPKSLNTSSIIVTRSGPDGLLGTKDDVNVPIDASSIAAVYLATTPKGPEQISFTVSGTLPNDLYQVTLKGTGSTPITDIAGNGLAGTFTGTFPTGVSSSAPADFNSVYVLFNQTSQVVRYVGATATYQTDPAATQGSRTNPFPTIAAAIAASPAGDVVGVLPGVYTEKITLKPFVRILSTATASHDNFFIVGNALTTVLRAPANTGTTANITVSAINLPSIPGIDTEIAGLSIASPLLFNPASGFVDPNSVAIYVKNSDVLIDRNYIVNAQMGIDAVTSGDLALTPRILSNGIIGNTFGVFVDDSASTISLSKLTSITNNTIAFNTVGVRASNNSGSPLQAAVNNNIFWQNHDQTTARSGLGAFSTNPNKIVLRNNMFQGNGASDTNPVFAGANIGNGFDPAALKSTPDSLGNFVGNPAFVSPRDPRTGLNGDGPGIFFSDANFDLTLKSAAIDAANSANAPPVDFLLRGRVRIAGRGFPGTGPADVGAFEFHPPAGTIIRSAFQVATATLSTSTGAPISNFVSPQATPNSVTVDFTDTVDPSTVNVSDLVLSGTGLNSSSPAKATSLSWIDSHTVKFNLAGAFNSTGTINVSVPAGVVKSANHVGNTGFSQSFTISQLAPIPVVSTSPTGGTTLSPSSQPLTPPPAAAPVTPKPVTAPKGPAHHGVFRRAKRRA